MNKINYIVLLGIVITLTGCGATIPSKMTNTSPDPSVQEIKNYKTIPVSLSITADDPKFVSDVSIALREHNVFSKLVSNKGVLQLDVKHEKESNHHFGKGMGNAVLEGLTLGLSGDSPDEFDFSIVVNADLKYKNKIISSYKTKGSFNSVVSSRAALSEKLQRTKDVVFKSYQHALDLLSTKIKKDRRKIIKFMKKS